MAFAKPFFDFQIDVARRLAAQFDLSLGTTLARYTTFSTLFAAEWDTYVGPIEAVPDLGAWTYEYYLSQRSPDPQPDDATYQGEPLFGCFYYHVREATTIRVHFIKNDPLSSRPLARPRMAARHAELARMFAHIRAHVPAAQRVLGNSWLYNIEAYRRLYPPAYTAELPVSDEAEFNFLAFWGQCFDHAWNPKPALARVILQQVAHMPHLDALRWCFPYQILQPAGSIADFYQFYAVE